MAAILSRPQCVKHCRTPAVGMCANWIDQTALNLARKVQDCILHQCDQNKYKLLGEDVIFKRICLKENSCLFIKVSLKFFQVGQETAVWYGNHFGKSLVPYRYQMVSAIGDPNPKVCLYVYASPRIWSKRHHRLCSLFDVVMFQPANSFRFVYIIFWSGLYCSKKIPYMQRRILFILLNTFSHCPNRRPNNCPGTCT